MSRTEKVTLTNMCMVYDQAGNVLVQKRKDSKWPGFVFPGGHIEKEEAIIESVIREVKEETGLLISEIQQCGIKQFFTNDDGRYIVFLYKTCHFVGNIEGSDEGEVNWIKISDLDKIQLADGFKDMIPVFLGEAKELIYRNGGKELLT